MVVFDEARGLEDPSSRTAQHLEQLRTSVGARPHMRKLPLFVLAVLGTPFGGNLANAANLLTALRYQHREADRPVAALVREVVAAFAAMTVRRMLSVRCEVHRTLVRVPLNQQQSGIPHARHAGTIKHMRCSRLRLRLCTLVLRVSGVCRARGCAHCRHLAPCARVTCRL